MLQFCLYRGMIIQNNYYKMNMAYRGGQPAIVFTEKQIAELEEIGRNLNCAQIAGYFGISESAFYALKNRDERVRLAYQRSKAKGVKEAANLLWDNMKKGDNVAIIFYLKTQGRWSEAREEIHANPEIIETPEEREFRIARTKRFLKWEAEQEGKDE